MASNGAKMRGSVNGIDFSHLAGESESVETFPGFARYLGENWSFLNLFF